MSYVGLIRNLVGQALTRGKLLKDIPVTVTYYSGDDGNLATFDPLTQTTTVNETTGFPVYAVVVSPTQKQIDNNNAILTDRYFLFSITNLLKSRITEVKVNDRVKHEGKFYTILPDVFSDPTGSLWTAHGRIP